ncbi:hypothetical protein D1114_23205 [Cereibacter sphaeroides]|uniref:Uncharacterized protein n=1 Tax=Cereibacter sphaeroides TaxID=1063 RepID=A0AAX1UEF3_CERSP|nr:hypothetical protein D1114_23205 [Cereibacter sphaeroides]
MGYPRDEAEATTETPSAPRFPDDLDWRSIDPRLAFDILAFANKVSDAARSTLMASEFASPPNYEEYYDTRCRAYAALGLEAARIGRVLRDTHHLPRRTFDRWSPEQVLAERTIEMEEEDRNEREQARKDSAMWALMAGG